MTRIFALSILAPMLLFCLSANAQRKKKNADPLSNARIYLFDENFDGAPSFDAAVFFMQMTKDNDSTFVCRYYNKYGPMVKQESYADSNLTIPNGRFCWYNFMGLLDSTGNVAQGRKDGHWQTFNGKKRITDTYYDNGKLEYIKDYEKNIYQEKGKNARPLDEKEKEDSIDFANAHHVQVEATFPKGINAWANYLVSNLQTPDRLVNILGVGVHEDIAAFTVNKVGKIEDVYLTKSTEWSGDLAILNLIKNAPNWVPATNDGRPVYYRQLQSLSFNVAGD